MIDKIFLIGFRAVGKSTVGRLVAERLGYQFLDTDEMIGRQAGASVQEIVSQQGWEHFRRLESEALLAAAQGGARVVATGGGAILHRQAWAEIGPAGMVVWLKADLAELTRRLQEDQSTAELRPSLSGGDIYAELAEVLAARTPLYMQTADLEVDTDRLAVAEIVATICLAYKQRQQRSEE